MRHQHHDLIHHEHVHHHNRIPQDRKILAWSFAVITVYMLVEFIGGWLFNSLTLMADAGHMVNDSLSLLLALIALFLSERKQAWLAFCNAASLIAVAVLILAEAARRWQAPPDIQALPMLGVAVIGLSVNILVAWIMLKSDRKNLNVKAAYLHVLADLFGSVVAIAAGMCAYFLGWQWVDVAASAVLSLFVLRSGINVMREVLTNFK